MRMITISFAVIIALFGIIEVDADDTQDTQPLIYFDKGRVGVNFFGFRAAAGLGGILTGNAQDGGLYAEAGTPFGQFAHAGLGGQVDEQGRSVGGGLFAGATAGNGIGAKTGLGGISGAGGSYGTSYAGASAGGLTKLKYKTVGAPVAGTIEVTKEIRRPEIEKNIQVIPSKNTQIEAVVEKQVGNVPPALDIDVRAGGDFLPPPDSTIYIEKRKFKGRRRPHLKRKQIIISRGEYDTLDSLPGPPLTPLPVPTHGPVPVSGDVGVGIYGGGGVGVGAQGGGGFSATKTVTVRKSINPQVITDAINVPIATLDAVSKLVGGISKNIGGSVTVNKEFSVNAGISKK